MKKLCACGAPVFEGDDDVCNTCVRVHRSELLEALKNFENDDGHVPDTIWQIRNAAIAKAEGRTPVTDVPSLIDLEDTMDFGDEARRLVSEAKRVADGEVRCPPCDGEGQVIQRGKSYECGGCDGDGWLTQDQQSRYYHEAGHSDADAERDAIARREQEEEQL